MPFAPVPRKLRVEGFAHDDDDACLDAVGFLLECLSVVTADDGMRDKWFWSDQVPG
jgi:hypothetical protein